MSAEKFAIKHRYTDAVLFELELPADVAAQPHSLRIGYAIREAVKARANLAGADLAGADLERANLAGADFAGADLAGAYLAGADLADALNVPSTTEQADPPEPQVAS